MSAPNRTSQKKTGWLKSHKIGEAPVSFREKVLDYLEAKPSLEKIMGPGLNEEFVWKWLWELARRADDRKPQASQWYRLPQQKLHTLRRLPKKVRGWAKTIKNVSLKIEASYAYSRTASSLTAFLESQVRYKLASPISEATARRILEGQADLAKLIELPKLLELYADQLEATCKFTAHYAPKAPARFRANLEFALIEYVKSKTGEPHYPEIATLLTASYAALGSGVIVDAHNLSAAYDRNSPWKRKKPPVRRPAPQ